MKIKEKNIKTKYIRTRRDKSTKLSLKALVNSFKRHFFLSVQINPFKTPTNILFLDNILATR